MFSLGTNKSHLKLSIKTLFPYLTDPLWTCQFKSLEFYVTLSLSESVRALSGAAALVGWSATAGMSSSS